MTLIATKELIVYKKEALGQAGGSAVIFLSIAQATGIPSFLGSKQRELCWSRQTTD